MYKFYNSNIYKDSLQSRLFLKQSTVLLSLELSITLPKRWNTTPERQVWKNNFILYLLVLIPARLHVLHPLLHLFFVFFCIFFILFVFFADIEPQQNFYPKLSNLKFRREDERGWNVMKWASGGWWWRLETMRRLNRLYPGLNLNLAQTAVSPAQ